MASDNDVQDSAQPRASSGRLTPHADAPQRWPQRRRGSMPRLKLPLALLWLFLLASCSPFQDRSVSINKELEVLQAAVGNALSQRQCNYISIGRRLGARQEDMSEFLLNGILLADGEHLEKSRSMVLDFWVTNSSGSKIRLSRPERRFIGQRGANLGHLTSGDGVCTVRLSRVGWSSDGQHALVYLGLQEGSLPAEVLLELERGEEGWGAAREWFSTETIILD